MGRGVKLLIVAVALAWAAAGLAATLLLTEAPARGAARAEFPPECVHWRVLDNSGAGPLIRVLVCGTGSNGESPARDDSNWATVPVDGDQFTPDGCGKTWTDPCVILWPASPQGVRSAT
jgi:hypothetical protein